MREFVCKKDTPNSENKNYTKLLKGRNGEVIFFFNLLVCLRLLWKDFMMFLIFFQYKVTHLQSPHYSSFLNYHPQISLNDE